jgi:hypothetical protein
LNPDLEGAAYEGHRQSMIEKYKRPINLQLANRKIGYIHRPRLEYPKPPNNNDVVKIVVQQNELSISNEDMMTNV